MSPECPLQCVGNTEHAKMAFSPDKKGYQLFGILPITHKVINVWHVIDMQM